MKYVKMQFLKCLNMYLEISNDNILLNVNEHISVCLPTFYIKNNVLKAMSKFLKWIFNGRG